MSSRSSKATYETPCILPYHRLYLFLFTLETKGIFPTEGFFKSEFPGFES
jgi:hypothetical protein